MSRKCLNSRDTFCYICGEFTIKSQRRIMTGLVKKAYELYFGCKTGDQDKEWAPHICCARCAVDLRAWLRGTPKAMPFAVPMVWREQRDHVTDCYFCLTNVSGFSSKNKKAIEYPNLSSAMRPVQHDESLPVPKAPDTFSLDEADEDAAIDHTGTTAATDSDSDFEPCVSSEPHLITQSELNDLVRDLGLSKSKAELLGSRLQGWCLLSQVAKVSVFRNRQDDLTKFFEKVDNLVFCTDIDKLFTAFGCNYDPQEWRLFIDSSMLSPEGCLIAQWQYPSFNTCCLCCTHEGNIRKYGTVVGTYTVYQIQLEHMWRSQSSGSATWTAIGIHKVLLLHLRMGQPC